MKKQDMKEFFNVLRLSRDDFRTKGYDASELSDDDMERVASKIGSIILDGGDFWLAIEMYGEENLPKSSSFDWLKTAKKVFWNDPEEMTSRSFKLDEKDKQSIAQMFEDAYEECNDSKEIDEFIEDYTLTIGLGLECSPTELQRLN